jgi:hypothetical protein
MATATDIDVDVVVTVNSNLKYVSISSLTLPCPCTLQHYKFWENLELRAQRVEAHLMPPADVDGRWQLSYAPGPGIGVERQLDRGRSDMANPTAGAREKRGFAAGPTVLCAS